MLTRSGPPNVVLIRSRLFKLGQPVTKVIGTSSRSLMQRDDKNGVVNGAHKDSAKRRGLAIFLVGPVLLPASSTLLMRNPFADSPMRSMILRKPGSSTVNSGSRP